MEESNALDGGTINPNAQGNVIDNTETNTVTTQVNNGNPSFEECFLQAKEEVGTDTEPAKQEPENHIEPDEPTKPVEPATEPTEAVDTANNINYQEAYENSKPVLEAVIRASQGDLEAQKALAQHLGIQIGTHGQQQETTPTSDNIPAEATSVANLMESFSEETFTNAVEAILEKKFGAFQTEHEAQYNRDMEPQREQAAKSVYDNFMEAHPAAKDPSVQNAMEPYVRAGYPLEDAFKIANYGNAVKTAEHNIKTTQAKQIEEAKKANNVLRQKGVGKTNTPKQERFKDFGEAYKWTKANMGA